MQDSIPKTTETDISEALTFISPDSDRELWVRNLMAIKSALGDAGYEIAKKWSKSSDKFNQADFDATWKSIKPEGGITEATLFKMASDNGYKPSAIGQVFKSVARPPKPKETPEQATQRRQKEARKHQKAQAYWDKGRACKSHPYLTRKGVKAHGLRVLNGDLLIPIYDGDWKLISVQIIQPDGTKRFLKGCKMAGGRFAIGKVTDNTLIIAEGYATAASIHQATGLCIAVAFSSGNLPKVAATARRKKPKLQIILAPDNDPLGHALKTAEKTALKLDCEICVPRHTGDFNDEHQSDGEEGVKRQFDNDCYRPNPISIESQVQQESESALEPELDDAPLSRKLRPQHPAINAPIFTRAYLYACFIIKGFISLLAAPGGVGKSIFLLVMACSLAIGRDLLGLGEVKQRRVLVLNNEDTTDEIERRLKAIIVARRLSDAEKELVAENIFIQSGYRERLQLAFEESESGAVVPTELQGELISFCLDSDIDVVFIDPLVSTNDSNENNNNAMNSVIQIVRVIAEEAGVGICIAHHSRKGATAETPDDNARGASAITAGVRVNYILSKMTPKESSKFVLAEDQWAHMVRLDSGKRNYSPNAAIADWFELKNIPLEAIDWETGEDSIEWVGVPTPVELQATERDSEGWTLERVMEAVVRTVPTSPFTRKGTAGESLKHALSDTKKPIGHSTLATRMSCFPEPHELPVQVIAFGVRYKCWTVQNSANNNQLFYHYEEI